MNYSWSVNLHDNDGDIYENCVLAHVGDNTILKFKDTNELEAFAERILHNIKEIRETHPNS